MAVFHYKAIRGGQGAVQGTISAKSPREARDLLRGRGLSVQTVAPQKASAARTFWKFSLGSNRNSAKLGAMIRELGTLLSVGVPVVEGLETLTRQERGAFRTAMMTLRDRVSSGASLAEAMAEQPTVFDELTIRMVEVGQNSGTLDVVLNQLADFKERSLMLKDKVLGAVLYPAIVFVASLLVTAFLMTVVVPMLLTSLLESGQKLPWPTRVLKVLSDFCLDKGWVVVIVALIAAFGIPVLLRTRRGKRWWHGLLLKVPVVGQMARKQTISRIAMVLATLMKSGNVYTEAAAIAAKACKNVVFSTALLDSNEAIRAGQDIGEALESTGIFPGTVVHLVAVGQASGKLEEMLETLAENYDRQVASLSSRLASALEPILIMFLAVIVGFILMATILPILEAGNVL